MTIDLINEVLTIITTLGGKLLGLPGYALVFILCLVAGFALKKSRRFPNDAIPVLVIVFGGGIFPCIADPCGDTLPLRVWIVRNFAIGCIIGAAAWGVHHHRRRIPYLKKLFPESSGTGFVQKPKPTTETDKENEHAS